MSSPHTLVFLRASTGRIVTLSLLALFLIGCTTITTNAQPTPTTLASSPVPTSSVQTSPTPEIATPAPLQGELGPAPENCQFVSAPATMSVKGPWGGFNSDTTFVGNAPVWIYDFSGALNERSQPVLHLTRGMISDSYPGTKILWEVGPDYPQLVTVRATNIQTGEPAWWDLIDPPYATTVMSLHEDMANLYHGKIENKWREWGSTLHIFQAGCYKLEVSWPAGSWSMVFAAGS